MYASLTNMLFIYICINRYYCALNPTGYATSIANNSSNTYISSTSTNTSTSTTTSAPMYVPRRLDGLQRPELCKGSVEYIVGDDYFERAPQVAIYIYMFVCLFLYI